MLLTSQHVGQKNGDIIAGWRLNMMDLGASSTVKHHGFLDLSASIEHIIGSALRAPSSPNDPSLFAKRLNPEIIEVPLGRKPQNGPHQKMNFYSNRTIYIYIYIYYINHICTCICISIYIYVCLYRCIDTSLFCLQYSSTAAGTTNR